MTKEEATLLHEVMQRMIDQCNADREDFKSRIIEDYSGRCMYGETTYALEISAVTCLLQAIMTFPEFLYDLDKHPIAQYEPISNFRTDSLGYSTVIY